MIKKMLFGILMLALVISPAIFAQGAQCTDGDTICDPSDSDYMWTCVNGYWADQTFCPDGCNPTTQVCNGMQNGVPCTTEWATKCDSADPDSILRCENDGTGNLEWNYYMSCKGLLCDANTNACFECSTSAYSPYCLGDTSNYCDAGYLAQKDCTTLIGGYCNATTGLCESNVFPYEQCEAFENGLQRCDPNEVASPKISLQQCQPDPVVSGVYLWMPIVSCFLGTNNELGCYDGAFYGDAYCKECGYPQTRFCPTIQAWQECQDDYKYSNINQCNYPAEICDLGVCIVNPNNQTNGTSCTIDAERCNSYIIEKCKNVSGIVDYYTDRACASDEYCEEVGSTTPPLAVCRKIVTGPTTGGSSGGSGGGSVSSGGGFMWHDEEDCTSYTSWQIISSTKFTKGLNDGTTQSCSNSTLERYCIQKNGETDTSRKETEYTVDCGQKTDKCDYVYDRTEKFVDRNEEDMCRSCEREVYVYTCQPSGQTDYANIKESTTCANYEQCEAEFPTAGAATQKGWIDILVDDWAVALGIILLLVIAGVAFLAYKMMDEDSGQGELE